MKKLLTIAFCAIFAIQAAEARTLSVNDIPTAGLVAYYPFDGTYKDASGNGYDLTEKQPVVFCEDRFGNDNGAMSFDGNGQYFERPDMTLWTTFTVACWFQTDVSKTSQGSASSAWRAGNALLYPSHGGSNAGVGLSVGTDGLAVTEHGSCWLPTQLNYSGTIGSGWNHVCMVVEDNTSIRLYLNGVMVSSGTLSSKLKHFRLTLGGEGWGYYTGKVDDLAIWDRALTADEAARLYTVSSAPVRTLYAHWAPVAYSVAFNANGGKGTMAKQKMSYGKAAKLRKNAFSRKGYVFLGWAKSRKGAVAYKNAASVKNLTASGGMVTLYAKWAKKAYKVKFYANGGKGRMAVGKFTYGKAKKLSANKFKAPKGKKFAGWATSKANAKKGKVAYKNKKAVKNLVATGKTVKLYAVWKKR